MEDQPNVLWLTLESVRADHTPMYGYHRNTTPNLLTISQRDDATVLSNTVSASNWTRPSTASMLTGTHYSTHNTGGRGARGTKLPDELKTLPELLQENGYHTALFSPAPQISTDTGLDRGFDHYQLIEMESSNFIPGNEYTRDSWKCIAHHFLDNPSLNPKRILDDVNGDTNYLQQQQIQRWVKQQATSSQPFFAYAHIWSPHSSFQPIRRYRHEYSDEVEMDLEEAYEFADREYQNLTEKIANHYSFNEEEWNALKALYDAEILYADEVLGNIVELVESISERELIIIVTGDHGELFGEKGVISHKIILHDGVIRVPGIIAGIDGIVDREDAMTQHIDLTRTVGQVTGSSSIQFEGRDLRDGPFDYAISQRREWDFSDYKDVNPEFDHSRYIKEPHTAVCTPEFKYIESSSNKILYNLPDETTDVADSYLDVVEKLESVIDREGIEWDEVFDKNTATFSEEAEQKLKDLGYLS